MTVHDALPTLRGRFTPYHDDMIAFAQRLVQTPSMPGDEGKVAELVRREMARLAYDEVWIDEAGNAIGLIRGATSGRSVLFNAHMDHVSVGDEQRWEHPPFSGAFLDGELWGRGAVDLKGSLAAMVYGLAALRREGMAPPWDVYVAGVVLEEQAGTGTSVLLQSIRPQFCVIGEATRNQLALGHRGITGLFVEITGRSAHASMVDLGVNPHFSAARFLLGLRSLGHESDPMLGASSAAPTLYDTDQTSGNVIPGLVRLYVDWRNVPGETPDSVMAQLDRLLQASLEQGTTGKVTLRQHHNRTYTGHEYDVTVAAWAVKLDPQSQLATRSQDALQTALGRPVAKTVWRFCTDGSICARAGVPIVGFGPGNEELAHTSSERVPLADLKEAMAGNAALALSPALAEHAD